jgi:hypothetical protein
MTTQPVDSPTAPPASTDTPKTTTESRPRRRPSSVGGKLGETLAFVGASALAAGGWYVGALFTLLALDAVGIPINRLAAWQWLIPLTVSAIEVRWWPGSARSEIKGILFAVIAGVDMLSTCYGFTTWAAGRFIPLGMGFTIPKTGAWLIAPAVIISLIFTFGPEWLARWSLREIITTWR